MSNSNQSDEIEGFKKSFLEILNHLQDITQEDDINLITILIVISISLSLFAVGIFKG